MSPDTTLLEQAFRKAALADFCIGPAFAAVPPLAAWVSVDASPAWFSPAHFAGTPGFRLPFDPADFVWTPHVVELPVNRKAGKHGYYRRGVAKYARALLRGETLPPVSFLYAGTQWTLQDGNHRYEAHVVAGRPAIRAVFAVARRLIAACPARTAP